MPRITSRHVFRAQATGARQTSMPAKTEIAVTRRSGVPARGGRSFPRARLSAERQPVQVHLHALGDVHVERGEEPERDDLDHVAF